jgi:hypothetical protein
LATISKNGRGIFNEVLVEKLNAVHIPAALKVACNKQIETITTT